MFEIVQNRHEELRRLCSRYGVLSLALFGSAARDDFESTSDLDFAVEFAAMTPDDHARNYFGLLKDLQGLFQRKIDLVEVSAVRNPYIRRNIEASQVSLYAA